MTPRVLRYLRLLGSTATTVVVLASLGGLFYLAHTSTGKTERPQTGDAGATSTGSDSEVVVLRQPGAETMPEATGCPAHLLCVQFKNPANVAGLNISVETVEERAIDQYISANGVVQYDQTRVAQLSTRAPGIVYKVEKQVGQAVKEGDVLAIIDSIDVGRAKAELLQAIAQVELKTKILANLSPSIVPERQIREAEAALREAQIRQFNAQQTLINLGLPVQAEQFTNLSVEQLARKVQFLGLPDEITKKMDPATTTANLIPVRSPLNGVVIGKSIVRGEVVGTTHGHFEVADVSHMWILLEVRLEDAHRLALGQPISFQLDGPAEEVIESSIDWISTAADEKTRTLRVRATTDNPYGKLRAHTFGTGRIRVRETQKATTVPIEAVQWDSLCHLVFVQLKEGLFQARKVRTGIRSGNYVEVLAGVKPGETVVGSGSHLLKAEILRSRFVSGN